MKFINKNTGDIISADIYVQLSGMGRANYIKMESSQQSRQVQRTHHTHRTESDSLGVCDAAVAVVALPLVAVCALFDF